jgi:hypothetical protein
LRPREILKDSCKCPAAMMSESRYLEKNHYIEMGLYPRAGRVKKANGAMEKKV